MEQIFNTACYTLTDALIWWLMGAVIGAEIMRGRAKH